MLRYLVIAVICTGCGAQRLAPSQLHCSSSIDTLAEPPENYRVLLGAVALDGSEGAAIRVGSSARSDPDAQWFAKTGLVVRADVALVLEVPPDQRDRMSIGGVPAPEIRSILEMLREEDVVVDERE